jgi:cytochrome b561
MEKPKRYHPLLVGIHWLSALLVLFMLLAGKLVLVNLPNTEAKIPFLAVHALTGILILVLTVARFIVRLATPRPAPATIGNKFLDIVGQVTHGLLYLGAFGMGISGLGIAVQSGLFQTIFGAGGSLPQSFYLFPPRTGHGLLATAMLVLIGLHIGAALLHQIVRKDNLIGRMSFGRKSAGG